MKTETLPAATGGDFPGDHGGGKALGQATVALPPSLPRNKPTILSAPSDSRLPWSEVRALLSQLGQVEEEPNGNLKVSRRGYAFVLHPSPTEDFVAGNELLALRQFLKRSEKADPASGGNDTHWLLVIDHHEARLFRSELGLSGWSRTVTPEPVDFFRDVQFSLVFRRSQESSDPDSFFGPIAQALDGAGWILVLGNGTGMSSEKEQFLGWAKHHHPAMSRRIISSAVIKACLIPEDQLLAKAREYYDAYPAS